MEFRIPEYLTDADKNVTLPLSSLLSILGKVSDTLTISQVLMSEVREKRKLFADGNDYFSLERKTKILNDHIFDMLADMNDIIPKKPIYGPLVVDLLRERPRPALATTACPLESSPDCKCCNSEEGQALLLAARAIEKTAAAPAPTPATKEEDEDLYA
jgi:hypothetical protein